MKKNLILLVIIVITIGLSNKASAQKPVKYLKLSEAELKNLGFVINDEGIFFKSFIPKGAENYKDGEIMGFYNDKKTYGTAIGPDASEAQSDIYSSIPFDKLKPVTANYYIVVVADMTGHRYYDAYRKETKVVPVFLHQSAYKFKDTKDLVIYFKYNDDLAAKLKDKILSPYITTLDMRK